MSGGYQLLLVIAGMHLLGLGAVAVLMVLALRQQPDEGPRPSDSGSDDGWGNEPTEPRRPSDRPWGGMPLLDSDQALIRLRDERKLRDLQPHRHRRPAREPGRPVRTPE